MVPVESVCGLCADYLATKSCLQRQRMSVDFVGVWFAPFCYRSAFQSISYLDGAMFCAATVTMALAHFLREYHNTRISENTRFY